jgi:acetyltransferase
MLVYLTDVDHVRHVGLIAVTQVYGRQVQVGEARYVIEAASPDRLTQAEFAIAVADDWQGAGVGSRLLRMLEKAACAAGIALLTGDVLGSNHKALDFMRQRGFATHPNRDEARLVRVKKNLLLMRGPLLPHVEAKAA